jgi:hypothetical protein
MKEILPPFIVPAMTHENLRVLRSGMKSLLRKVSGRLGFEILYILYTFFFSNGSYSPYRALGSSSVP